MALWALVYRLLSVNLKKHHYCALLYYINSGIHSWKILSVIVRTMEASIEAVEASLGEANAIVGPTVLFEGKKITLDIPEEGIVLESGWTITPLTPLQITKSEVDQFRPGKRVPSCQLDVKWTGQQEQPVRLFHRVKLIGAKGPFNFFMIQLPPPQESVSRSPDMLPSELPQHQLKSSGSPPEGSVTSITPSDQLDQPIQKKSDLPQHVQLSLEEEERHLRAYRIFVKQNKAFPLSILQLMAIGGPRMGKSSLLARLRGEKPPTIQDLPDTAHHPAITDGRRVVPSTGVAEKVIQLTTVIKKASVDTTFACKVGEVVIWSRVSYGEEVIALLKTMGMLMSLNPAPLTAATQSSLEITSHDNQHQPIPSTPDLTQTGGSEATKSLIHKSPEEIFKNALNDRNWSKVHSIFENSLTLFCTDTGGQPEFQEVLPALIAGHTVFMLIFRVTDQLDDLFQIQYEQSADQKSVPYMSSFTLKQVILQSLASIASITTFKRIDEEVVSMKPQVLLVATHKDQAPPERIPELQQELMLLLNSHEFYKKNIIKFASESTPAFIVNNLSDDQGDHQLIRSKVEEIASNKRYKEVTPAPWLVLSLVLRDLGVEAISYDQCLSIANSCGISTKEQLNEALWFLHVKLGLIRYFHDIPELQDVIILQPKVIFCNITELIAETFVFTKVGQHAQENFKKYGMFSSSDIEELVQLSSDHELLPVSKMVKLLEHLHILAPIQKEDGMYYFLPCVLAHAPEAPSREGKFLASCLILAFQCGYCPKGIFSGLIAYLLSQKDSNLSWKLDMNAVFQDEVHFDVGKHRHKVTIRMCLTHLKVSVEETTILQFRGKTEPHELCTSIQEALVKAIKVVSQTLHYSTCATLQIGFYCTHCSCIGNPQHTAICDDINDVDNPCPVTMSCTKTPQVMPLSSSELVWFGKQLRVLPANTKTTATADGAPLEQVPGLELNMKNVTNALKPVNAWHKLGILLGVPDDELKQIESNYPRDNSRCKSEMLSYWFNNAKEQSWDVIADALEGIGYRKLSNIIRRGPSEAVPSPPPSSSATTGSGTAGPGKGSGTRISSQVPRYKRLGRLELNNYCARLYYSSSGFHSWEFYLAVVCDLDSHAAAVHTRYTKSIATLCHVQEVVFERDMIILDLPMEGLVLQNGWTITPHTYPGITQHQVDRFVPGQRVPSCQLYVKWIGQQEQPVELVHRVDLLGAKEPNFLLIQVPGLRPPPQDSPYGTVFPGTEDPHPRVPMLSRSTSKSGPGVSDTSGPSLIHWLRSEISGYERRYCARLYYSSTAVDSWKVYFAIVRDIEVQLSAVDAWYTKAGATMGPDQEVVFEDMVFRGEKITLDIPKEGVVLGSGWTITPHEYPVVTKRQIQKFVPGREVPSCQLYVKWTGQQEKPVELLHRVDMLGAKEPCNFFLIRIPGLQPPSQVRKRNTQKLLEEKNTTTQTQAKLAQARAVKAEEKADDQVPVLEHQLSQTKANLEEQIRMKDEARLAAQEQWDETEELRQTIGQKEDKITAAQGHAGLAMARTVKTEGKADDQVPVLEHQLSQTKANLEEQIRMKDEARVAAQGQLDETEELRQTIRQKEDKITAAQGQARLAMARTVKAEQEADQVPILEQQLSEMKANLEEGIHLNDEAKLARQQQFDQTRIHLEDQVQTNAALQKTYYEMKATLEHEIEVKEQAMAAIQQQFHQMKSTLEHQLQEREQAKVALEQQLEEKEKASFTLEHQLQEKEQAKVVLEHQHQEKEQVIEALKHQLQEREQAKMALEHQLRQARVALEKQIQAKYHEIEELERQLHRKDEQIKTLQQSQSAHSQSKATQVPDLSEDMTKHSQAESWMDASVAHNAPTAVEVAEVQNKSSDVQVITQEGVASAHQLLLTRKEVGEREEELRQATELVAKLRLELESKNLEVVFLRCDGKEKDDEIAAIKGQRTEENKSLRVQVDSLQQDLKNLHHKIIDKDLQLAEVEFFRDVFSWEVDQLRDDVMDREVEIDFLRKQLIDLLRKQHMPIMTAFSPTSSPPVHLRGADVVAETTFTLTQETQNLQFKGYGFKLHVPEDSLPAEMSETKLTVKVSLSGQFQMPPDCELLSAVYWVYCSHKFTKPLTLEIQHCAILSSDEQCSELSFVSTKCTQPELPYVFKTRDRGVFSCHSSYGSLSLSHFSGFGVVRRRASRQSRRIQPYPVQTPSVATGEDLQEAGHDKEIFDQYCGQVYTRKGVNDCTVQFVITKNLDAHRTVVEEFYSKNVFVREAIEMHLSFKEEVVGLSIPRGGEILESGWKIMPRHNLVIRKVNVDHYSGSPGFPKCALLLRWTHRDKPPVCLEHQINVTGAKNCSFFTLYIPDEAT